MNRKVEDQPSSPINVNLSERSWDGSEQEVQSSVRKKPALINQTPASDGSLQSPKLSEQLPLLSKRGAPIKLSKL